MNNNVISLKKGEIINLSKISKSNNYEFKAKWDLQALEADVDITAVLCGSNGKAVVPSPAYLVFYNNKSVFNDAVKHHGDSITGGSGNWDEIIEFNLDRLPSDVHEIPLIVTIHEPEKTGLNFGLVKQLTVEIYDKTNNMVVAEFKPDSTNSVNTSMVLGSFRREGDGFAFAANGLGKIADLGEMLGFYGFATSK
ncbi:MAG: TerD family protein [Sarcina sp.]